MTVTTVFVFAIAERLHAKHSIRVRVMPIDVMPDSLRRYDHHRRQLLISELVDPSGRTFQAAYWVGSDPHFSP